MFFALNPKYFKTDYGYTNQAVLTLVLHVTYRNNRSMTPPNTMYQSFIIEYGCTALSSLKDLLLDKVKM